jgi:type IV pilus assembly protein PilM
MIRLTKAQLQPIGLDIGHDSIKMIQLESSGSTLSVHAAARQALSDEVKSRAAEAPEAFLAASVELIKQMLRGSGGVGGVVPTGPGCFTGRHVVAALPRQLVHVKNLRLPMIPADEIAGAVEFEARNVFPFDTDQAYVRFLHAGEVRQGSDVKQEVIVLAARHADVDQFLEQLHRCDVVVESLDFEPSAIYRGVERFIRRREDENEVHVLVDVGFRRSQVVIGRGRDITFVKPIDIGGQQITDVVSRKLGITMHEASALRRRLNEPQSGAVAGVVAGAVVSATTIPDAQPTNAPTTPPKRDPVRQAVYDATRGIMEELGREIALCLRYCSVTFRGQRASRVKLIGGEAADADLLAALQTVLPIPAEAGRPLHSIDTSRMKPTDRRGTMSEWAVAVGLGLKKTTGYFGARDGRPRDPYAPREDLAAPVQPEVQVVDLNQAVKGAAAATTATSSTTAVAADATRAEVANA